MSQFLFTIKVPVNLAAICQLTTCYDRQQELVGGPDPQELHQLLLEGQHRPDEQLQVGVLEGPAVVLLEPRPLGLGTVLLVEGVAVGLHHIDQVLVDSSAIYTCVCFYLINHYFYSINHYFYFITHYFNLINHYFYFITHYFN